MIELKLTDQEFRYLISALEDAFEHQVELEDTARAEETSELLKILKERD